MALTTKRLLDLTAAELMSKDVITIPVGMSLRAAAHRLALAGVSGAPVIDETGRCVGVLSKSDLVRFLDQGPHRCLHPERSPLGYCAEWQVQEIECLPTENVSNYMTKEVISASSDTRIGDLARLMHEEHVHRILITDVFGHVIGVVSSMDILGAVAAEDDSFLVG
jgi:predicted transcriptional regulator